MPWKSYGEVRGLNAPPRSNFAPALATASAERIICSSLSTEHGPAITTNSSPPISVPFTRMRVFPLRNSLLTNLYGAVMRITFSTCGSDSTDSRQAVTSPTPTTPITTRSSPSIECTLYPKFFTIPQTCVDLFSRCVEFHGNNHVRVSLSLSSDVPAAK